MPHSTSLSRRMLLAAMGTAALPLAQPQLARAEVASRLLNKRLIIVTLSGGNDGLNTVVPYRDPLYRSLRPSLALPTARCLPISADVALHPALVQMRAIYEAGELSVVQDVGYPSPNLSHFASADIWNAGSTETKNFAEHWYGNAVSDNAQVFVAQDLDCQAMLFSSGAATGVGNDVVAFQASQLPLGNDFEVAQAITPQLQPGAGSVVRMLARAPLQNQEIASRIAKRIAGHSAAKTNPAEDGLYQQVALAQWVLARGVKVPLLRLEQGGYDTHSGQLPRQAERLNVLDTALARLRNGLRSEGLWQDSVVLVQSEFGRRAAQNGYDGTDHGAAGPVFLLGGGVAGGVYGQRSALDNLDGLGNLRYGIDFRRLYASVLQDLWQLPVNRLAAAGYAPLDMRLT